jgi:hypothetical protein
MDNEVQKIRYLYGATTQPEFLYFVRTQCVNVSEDDIPLLLDKWRKSVARFIKITQKDDYLPEDIIVEDIPPEFRQKIAEIENDSLFKKSFSSLPYSFKLVNIERIVAGQRYVNIDYTDKLVEELGKATNMESLLDFSLKGGFHNPPVPAELQLSANVYSYKSASTDFRFLGGFPKKLSQEDYKYAINGGMPVSAIILFVGYGSPAINVFQVGKRLILNNGFHRLYALLKAGISKAPVVVQHITNWNLELEPNLLGLPTQYLVTERRPSLIRDFLDADLTTELAIKARDKSVQIQWNISQFDIPR